MITWSYSVYSRTLIDRFDQARFVKKKTKKQNKPKKKKKPIKYIYEAYEWSVINLSTEKTQTCCSDNRFQKQKHLTEPYLALIIIEVNNKISVATICSIRHYVPLFATIRHYLLLYSPLFATIRHYSRPFALFTIRDYSLFANDSRFPDTR